MCGLYCVRSVSLNAIAFISHEQIWWLWYHHVKRLAWESWNISLARDVWFLQTANIHWQYSDTTQWSRCVNVENSKWFGLLYSALFPFFTRVFLSLVQLSERQWMSTRKDCLKACTHFSNYHIFWLFNPFSWQKTINVSFLSFGVITVVCVGSGQTACWQQ